MEREKVGRRTRRDIKLSEGTADVLDSGPVFLIIVNPKEHPVQTCVICPGFVRT